MLLALQLAIVAYLAQDNDITRNSGLFPLNIVDDRIGAISSHRAHATAMMLAVVLLQTIVLVMLGRAVESAGASAWRIVAAGAVAMYAIALLAPALTSADMYSYSGYALLGYRAYAPPDVPFQGQYSPISTWWHIPMEPAPYGPLWIGYNHLLLVWAPTLTWKFAVLRLAGVMWLVVILRCMAQQRVRTSAMALFVLNPVVAFQFVANGHNDVIGVGLALLALVASRFGPWLQATLVIAAGLVKLPFVALGILMLRGPLSTRALAAAVATLVTFAASAIIGGRPYISSLLHHAKTHAEMFSLPHALLLVYVVVAIVFAVVFKRWSVVAPFSFPSMAAAIFPWYVLWGLPYALAGRSLAFFLAALPLVCFLFDPAFDTLWLLFAAMLVIAAAAGRDVFAHRRKATTSAGSGAVAVT